MGPTSMGLTSMGRYSREQQGPESHGSCCAQTLFSHKLRLAAPEAVILKLAFIFVKVTRICSGDSLAVHSGITLKSDAARSFQIVIRL
jgi:hypothetical protein